MLAVYAGKIESAVIALHVGKIGDTHACSTCHEDWVTSLLARDETRHQTVTISQ